MSGTVTASVFAGLLLSCDAKEITDTVKETTDKLVKALDDTRATVEIESGDWQTTAKNAVNDAISGLGSSTSNITQVLQDLLNKLPEQVNATIRGEINNLAQRAVASVGTEAKCTADFVRLRVIEGLRHVQDMLMGVDSPPPPPHICQVVPLVVDMSLPAASRNHIELYGFNMDQAPVQASLERNAGQLDITNRIDRPSHYHLTINLSGATPLLDKTSRRIRITTPGDTPHTIAVLQPETKVCQTQTVNVDAQFLTVQPKRTGGGGDFHYRDSDPRFFGPRVAVTTALDSSDDWVKAFVRVSAVVDPRSRRTLEETLKNPMMKLVPQLGDEFKRILETAALGEQKFDVYKAPIGWKITRVSKDDVRASFSYDDKNFELDSFDQGNGGLVGRYEVNGACKGEPDAGGGTKVKLKLNPFQVELQKEEDCVPPNSLRLSRAFLSKAVLAKFKVENLVLAAQPAAAQGVKLNNNK